MIASLWSIETLEIPDVQRWCMDLAYFLENAPC